MKNIKLIIITIMLVMLVPMILALSSVTNSNLDASVTILNSPPNALNVSITPRPALINDTLTGHYVYDDLENNTQGTITRNWWINGVSTGYNTGILYSGNLSANSTIIFSVRPCDIYDCGNWTNSSMLVIGDITPPSSTGQFINPISVTVNTPTNIYVNISKIGGSPIEYVSVTLKDPNDQQYTFSMINDVGNRYVKTYIPALVGTYQITNFTYGDTSGNTNYTESSLTFTSNPVPQIGSGGGTTTTTTVIVGGSNETFTFLTEVGSKTYDLQMPLKSERTKKLIIKNKGSLVSNYTTNCVGTLCQYLTFSRTNMTLYPQEEGSIDMTITIPYNLNYNVQYVADIEATNTYDNKEKINVKVTTSQFAGTLVQILDKFSKSTDLTKWLGINKSNPDAKPINIPNWILIFAPLILALVIMLFALKSWQSTFKAILIPSVILIMFVLIMVFLP